MPTFKVSLTFVNADKDRAFGDEVFETEGTRGDIYRDLLEFGRCTGKIYRDRPTGGVDAVGWVFQSRQEYTDTSETYLREVWATLEPVEEAAPEEEAAPDEPEIVRICREILRKHQGMTVLDRAPDTVVVEHPPGRVRKPVPSDEQLFVDVQSANIAVQVYDALSEKNRRAVANLRPSVFIQTCWNVLNR